MNPRDVRDEDGQGGEGAGEPADVVTPGASLDPEMETVLLGVLERDEAGAGEEDVEGGQEEGDGPDTEHRRAALMDSWASGVLGRLPSVGFPARGVKGMAVMAGIVVVLVALVAGGVKGVQAFTGSPGEDAAGSVTVATGSSLPSPTGVGPTRERSAAGTPSRTTDPAAANPAGGGAAADPDPAAGQGRNSGGSREPTTRGTTQGNGGSEPTDTSSSSKTSAPAAAAADTITTVGVLRNLVTGFCADLDGTGTVAENVLVRQRACSPGSGDNQEYQTVKDQDGSFLLRNVKSQWCLDVNGSGSVNSGVAVNTHNCLFGSRDNQMFRARAQGNGFYLVHVKSGLCLNVANPDGSNKVAGLKLTLYPCHPDDDHIWRFG
ncbi:RICIN domain-containing protein [Kineosporia sp. NBRC 101731]|uniref:RICIN domain-containing protein n=1 Tax=Kineosporia sp. NBRC 101731 TaxID=3032199 RepID=UPI0024A1FDC9|nr:RICIN domain-containing protein [Kineosporia sp. NBRC 101731]GLY28881.1 hypothetical protein Kisp02_22460 [Kineosporia sp. NBRC 101731]